MGATTAGPATDDEVPGYVAALGLPGLADVHVHFLPESVLRKVWAFFDQGEQHYGMAWPIQYRQDEQTRLRILRELGVRAIPALNYPHKPGMAAWLNDWSGALADRESDVIRCATVFPEPDAADYLTQALDAGARLVKMHVQVGGYAPDDVLLEPVWDLLAHRAVPVVLHAGSGPRPGAFTGPDRVRAVLARHPGLVLVIAHLGMPEYDAFADLAEEHPGVYLDTTMAGTDFIEASLPMPPGHPARLAALTDKVVLGSDFPNIPYPYAHQLQALARLELGDEWMRKVLWHNGSRLLAR